MAGDRSARHDSSMNDTSTPSSGKKSQKRKRDLDGSTAASSTPTKKSKKNEGASPIPLTSKESRKHKKRSEVASDGKAQKEATSKKGVISPHSSKTTTPSRHDSDTRAKKKSKSGKRKSTGEDSTFDTEATHLIESTKHLDQSHTTTNKKNKRKQSPVSDSSSSAEEAGEKVSEASKNKFAGILSKFERSARVKEAAVAKGYGQAETRESDENLAEPVIAKGLEPIPQPEAAPEKDEKPTYSSLPTWLAHPIRTSSETRTKFSDLGIDANLLRVLEDNGYKEAFAVQSTVIPLLLKGPQSHRGDLCVSAATGSGKTLSYVLPLVAELEQIPAPRLRGLIVVPTRELVKQAREACEFCAAGSGLRVGSAVGNVAIKDEQRSLMRIDQVYSPETLKVRQQSDLTGEEWAEFNLLDYISNTTDLGEALPGYIHRPEPNIDILICTPGRLVDHIRYTKGFSLKHLQWLVIDEADRLLNESFQEWVDVVIGSLDARKAPGAFGPSGEYLGSLGYSLQTKDPRKVILSATMTRDISKLNSLRLCNPKLVIVGSSDPVVGAEDESSVIAHSDDKFTLPSTLKEYSVSVGDGSQKPLYLLRLLLSHIKIGVPRTAKHAASESGNSTSEETSSDDSSSDETSSEGSSSDTDSDSSDTSSSGSDSDSDTSSDSSSESTSTSSDSDSETMLSPQNKPSKPATPGTTVLIFTKSSESASRLSRLIALLNPSLSDRIGTIIKSNKSSASRKTLTAYRRGKLSIIIATDRASRGLDLQSLTHVVNYDVPTSVTTYVHRVGRTARAGRDGSAWTLVAHREGRWFTNEISKGSNGKITRSAKVERVPVKMDNMKEMKSRYAAALDVLEREVKTSGHAMKKGN